MTPKLNEIQHQILTKTSVQMLIERFDCEVIDTGYQTRSSISQRVQSWMDKAATAGPRIISEENPAVNPFADKSEWMKNQKAVHGPGWSPF